MWEEFVQWAEKTKFGTLVKFLEKQIEKLKWWNESHEKKILKQMQ